jgi:hypothetical protein
VIVIWDRARVFSDGDIRDVRLEVKGRACSTRETTKTKRGMRENKKRGFET